MKGSYLQKSISGLKNYTLVMKLSEKNGIVPSCYKCTYLRMFFLQREYFINFFFFLVGYKLK